MKNHILQAIYAAFDTWSAPLSFTCGKGCATCCTQNVMITALEGERILRFVQEQGLERWFAGRLQTARHAAPPPLTTNEYALDCLEGRESSNPGHPESPAPCPFLEENCCTIYPVRPFGCRCFASEEPCHAGKAAMLPDYYIAASTALMQLVEHLGQHEYWGNMLDVLLALCDISTYKPIAALLPNQSLIIQARLRTRIARPLPGFLLLDQDQEKVAPLLDSIFSTRIDGKSIADILNGRRSSPLP